MKSLVDEYSVDYRSSEENFNYQDMPCQDEEETSIENQNYKTVLKKLTTITLLFLSVIGVIYEVVRIRDVPVLFGSEDIINIRQYDDFIFPLVMLDPSPFNNIQEVDPITLVSSSLWKIVLEQNIDQFDEEGFSLVSENKMWENFDVLFGDSYHPTLPQNIDNDFFKFNSKDATFHIKPTSNQKCYIPYTENLLRDEDNVILKVGYVSPNDKWRSLKSERPDKPEPVKFLNYKLAIDNRSNSVYIRSVSLE